MNPSAQRKFEDPREAEEPADGPPVSSPAPWYGPDAVLNGILLSNAVTLAGALVGHWSPLPVLWVYWGQSVSIGVVNVVRMMCLDEFSTEGFTSNGGRVPETAEGKRSTASFFALHFGGFHLVYALFLASGHFGRISGWLPLTIVLNVATFAWFHAWPLIRTHGHDMRAKRPNIGALMFYPYLRIIPMHLTIILGTSFPAGALPLFMMLKTGADVGLHFIERKLFLKTE